VAPFYRRDARRVKVNAPTMLRASDLSGPHQPSQPIAGTRPEDMMKSLRMAKAVEKYTVPRILNIRP
jgi:hypothetical protein